MNDDRISELYKGEIWSDALQQRAQRRIHWLCSQATGDTVIDIGCSQGIASIILAREGFTVTGIDIQPSRIEYANADLEDEPDDVRSRVRFVVGNGAHLDFENDSVDTVLLGEVIEHLAVPERLLDEVRRVLRPGGRVVITTPFGLSPHHDHKQTFYPSGVVEMISKVLGVELVNIVDRYFRIVATKPSGDHDAASLTSDQLLGMLDSAFEEIEEERARDQAGLKSAREEIRSLRGEIVTIRDERVTESRQRIEAERALKQAKGVAEREVQAAVQRAELVEQRLSATAKELTEVESEKRKVESEKRKVESEKRKVESEKRKVESEKRKVESEKRGLKNALDAERRLRTTGERKYVNRIFKLEDDRWKLRSRLAVSNWKIRSLMSRKWWRLGVAVGQVKSNPFRIFVLPFDFVSIVFSRSNLPKRPTPGPRPKRPAAKPRATATNAPKTAPTPKATEAKPEPVFVVPKVDRAEVAPRRDILVATLLDEFSFDLFEHEFRAEQVTPSNWRSVLEKGPSMLLVESAWRGKDDSWMKQLANEDGPSKELRLMVAAFRDAEIPTVFWNKEDPPNYHLYIATAKIFDTVFTVCEESIPAYVEDLGHDRVYLLPFSVQPKIHNPIAVGKRSNGVAFAGTYYAKKHPERVAQVDAVLDPAREFDFSIFTRVVSSGNYKWPERFEPFIVGSLSYQDVLTAYKMYDVFLNVNSVVDSESMCARRIFELAACGTPIVSGTSPAIERYFGDIVLQAEDADAGRIALRALLGSEEMRSRTALRGIRTAMREHTATLRVDEIFDRSGVTAQRTPAAPPVSLVVPTNRPGQMTEILENVGRQSYSNLQLVIAAHGFDLDEADLKKQGADLGVDNIIVARVNADRTLGDVINAGFGAADGAYIGKIDDDNFYGSEFVGDLIDAFEYTDAGIVGKWSHYTYVEGLDAMVLRFPGFEHAYVELVAGSAMIVERSVFDTVQFPSERVGEDTQFLRSAKKLGVRTYSTDRYNYVYMRYSAAGHHTFNVSDVELAAKGELVQYGLNLAHVTV